MSDAYRPRLGRFAPPVSALAATGCLLALVLMLVPHSLGGRGGTSLDPSGLDARARRAEDVMTRAEDVLRAAKARAGVAADEEAGDDPSGLLGSELTPLVTTLGNLEAKRISTNPRWASVLTDRLAAEGIGRGDLVAAGFSGSFPGLNLAVMAACRSLGAELVAISSVTASTWGANQPGFTWPEMEARLVDANLLPRASIAVTAGGEADMASGLETEDRAVARSVLSAAARRLGVPALEPGSFQEAVTGRLACYRRAAGGRRVALYVNVGGASASLGRSAAILRLRSGFIPGRPFDASPERGVTARFADQGVRILMLLNVRDLAARWGVPLAGRTR